MSTAMHPSFNELVVVTGASTGIGAATARELARRGYHVLAGVRRDSDADALRAEHIEPHTLDITVDADVAALSERVAQDPEHRRLRALVNNAGIAVNAPVESLPMTEWHWQFEVNLFGHIAMTQALLPALLESSGTVVNISSVGGRVAMATYGAYAGSKFAMEAVSDALRREVAGFGVKVIVIEPGAVTTEMSARGGATVDRLAAGMTPDQHGRYDALLNAITTQSQTFTRDGVPASKAAGVIADAIAAKRPRTRYTVGRDAYALVRLGRLAPDRFLDWMLHRALKPHYAGPEGGVGAEGATARDQKAGAMSKQVPVTVRASAGASIEQTFDVAMPVDLTKIFTGYAYLPAIVAIQNQTGPWDHVGVSRNPVFDDGNSAFEQITTYEPPTYFDYDVSRFTNVLGRLVTGAHGSWKFSLAADAPEQTVIEWTYAFDPKPFRRTLVRALITPVWRRYMRRALALTVHEVELAASGTRS